MTEADAAGQALADQIAVRGRDALVQRLRKAYLDAAAAHADIVSLDEERIDAMVQAAAERADGLQWRRALAEVAAQELNLSLAEALAHPAVARAQELVGAPSYEASLAELVARPVPPARPAQAVPAAAPEPAAPEPADAGSADADADASASAAAPGLVADDAAAEASPTPEPVIEEELPLSPRQPERVIEEPESHGATDELEAVEADDQVVELLPPPEPIEYEAGAGAIESDAGPDPSEPEPDADPGAIAPEAGAEADQAEEAAAADTAAEAGAEYVGEPTQPHAIEEAPPEEQAGEVPEHAGSWADGAAPESYGADYGAEHTVYPPPEDQELRVTAHHLGGVANLPAGRNDLDLRLSESGLDILQPAGEIIGRLHWNEIDALEVNAVRGRLRRQARANSRIIVRTKQGDASFEIPGLTSEELHERVDPLLSRYGAAH